MSKQLQEVIAAAWALAPDERHRLIEALTAAVMPVEPKLSTAAMFWSPRAIEESAASSTMPVEDIRDLEADFWPEDESADELIRYVYEQRRQDRSNGH